jgi:hypothetical protein
MYPVRRRLEEPQRWTGNGDEEKTPYYSEKRNAKKILVYTPNGRRPLGRPKIENEDHIIR